MDSLKEYEEDYGFLIDHFKEERIISRYQWIYDLMEDFIKHSQITNDVIISVDILNHVVIDYFVDIYRLKEFQNIKKTHDSKIYAYLIFWILRHKPIQILKSDKMEELVFINEGFACELLRSYLFSNPNNIPILDNQKETVDNFVDTLLYYFKYRDYSAKSIEIVILAFEAGRGYQYSSDFQE